MKKQTKRYNMILIGLILVLLVFIVVWKLQKREDLYFHVGIAVYDLGDSFIESYIEELQEQIEEHNIAGKKYHMKFMMREELAHSRRNSYSICMHKNMT